MPIGVLSSRSSVKVKNRVDSMSGANVDDTIEMFEALWFEDTRVQVILEVTVVEGDTNAVETERFEKSGVFV